MFNERNLLKEETNPNPADLIRIVMIKEKEPPTMKEKLKHQVACRGYAPDNHHIL